MFIFWFATLLRWYNFSARVIYHPLKKRLSTAHSRINKNVNNSLNKTPEIKSSPRIAFPLSTSIHSSSLNHIYILLNSLKITPFLQLLNSESKFRTLNGEQQRKANTHRIIFIPLLVHSYGKRKTWPAKKGRWEAPTGGRKEASPPL